MVSHLGEGKPDFQPPLVCGDIHSLKKFHEKALCGPVVDLGEARVRGVSCKT